MSVKINEIEQWMKVNKYTTSIEELIIKESQLINEYNKITYPYRKIMTDMSDIITEKKREKIKNCKHRYIRYCEYHNDRYKICDLCGHEA